jgi:uncharacterized membrane protein YidH (DUF202 family)
MLRTILLVLLVVVVLDLFFGANRSARATRAARFGRSLPLPRLKPRSMLRAILLVLVVVVALVRSTAARG